MDTISRKNCDTNEIIDIVESDCFKNLNNGTVYLLRCAKEKPVKRVLAGLNENLELSYKTIYINVGNNYSAQVNGMNFVKYHSVLEICDKLVNSLDEFNTRLVVIDNLESLLYLNKLDNSFRDEIIRNFMNLAIKLNISIIVFTGKKISNKNLISKSQTVFKDISHHDDFDASWVDYLYVITRNNLTSAAAIKKETGLGASKVNKLLAAMEEFGYVSELKQGKRELYITKQDLDILFKFA